MKPIDFALFDRDEVRHRIFTKYMTDAERELAEFIQRSAGVYADDVAPLYVELAVTWSRSKSGNQLIELLNVSMEQS